MRNKNELRRLVIFQPNECDAMKAYLEEMALKGWKLKKFRTFFYFERIEPQKLHYSVEVFAKASTADTIPANDTKEYIEYCRQAGWEFICMYGQINIFVSNSENPIPIETDEKQKFKTIINGFLKQNALNWVVLTPLLTLSEVMSISDFGFFTTSNLALISLSVYVVYVAIIIIQATSFIVWMFKQNKRLKRGAPIQYVSKGSRRKTLLLYLIPLAIIATMFSVAFGYSLFNQDYSTAWKIGFNVAIFLVLLRFAHYLQKLGLSRMANKVVPTIMGMIISLFVIQLAVATVIFAPTEEKYANGIIDSSETFLASSTTYHYQFQDGKDTIVTVFKSNFEFVMDQYLRSEMKRSFKEYVETNEHLIWNAESVYVAESTYVDDGHSYWYKDYYYIEYADCVISFEVEGAMTTADIEQIKLFTN